jgi:acetyl esterase/lipase
LFLLCSRNPRRRHARILALVAVGLACASSLTAFPARVGAQSAPLDLNVTHYAYTTVEGQPLQLIEFRQLGARVLPAVLVVHGGGWSHGSAEGFADVARTLAANGFAAFDVEYTLDRVGHPGLDEQPTEIRDAARYVFSHRRELRVRPTLGALGASAGGNLVVRVALSGDSPELRAVASWSGPMDLMNFAPMVERECSNHSCGRHWLANDLLDYVGCLPSRCRAFWLEGSPLDGIRRIASALLLFNSDHELVPLEGVEHFVQAMHRAENDATLVIYRGHLHAGEYGSRALPATIRFLRNELG